MKDDPRRPEAVIPFKLPMIPEEDADSSQQLGFFGLALGVMGLLLKKKEFSWTSLLLTIMSIVNRRLVESDVKQGWSALLFSTMGLALLYIQMFTQPASSSIFDMKKPQ
ncbi:hypothetical protein BC833DRAFT_581955 [Globomyces pollinis-pini]|nr:hypothetical protein BC833DRAFT_581955 [Globomyces pollinis-pini]